MKNLTVKLFNLQVIKLSSSYKLQDRDFANFYLTDTYKNHSCIMILKCGIYRVVDVISLFFHVKIKLILFFDDIKHEVVIHESKYIEALENCLIRCS